MNNSFIKAIAVFVFYLFATLPAYAQTGIVRGLVGDAAGNPLAGASVAVEGSRTGTTTNSTGHYSLTLSPGKYTIVVSFVGLASQKAMIDLGPGSTIVKNFITSEVYNQENAVTVSTRSKFPRSRLETPVPVDELKARDLEPFSNPDLPQMLTYAAPSFQSARQTVADGTDHIDPAQLRGLGSDQLLVLVNGTRRHQSALVNVNGTVNRGQTGTDLGAIPSTAIERIEILRDGAAAQYGSDAIAGVINIILKKNTRGLSGSVSYGTHTTAYPKNYALHLGSGKNPLEKTAITDGANLQVALNYGVALGKRGYLNINGEFTQRDPSNRAGTYTGQVYPSVGGINKDDSILAARGTNRNTFDMRIGNSGMKGGSLMLNSAYAIGKGWELRVFGGFSKKKGEAAGFYRYPLSIFSGAGTLYRDQALTRYPEGFLPLIQSDIRDISFSAGVAGKLGSWDVSVSNSFGINDFNYTVDHSINYTQFAQGPDVQTQFDAGGIRFLQNTAVADLTRKFNILGGLNVAYGAEFRLDQYRQTAGEEASYTNYNTSSGAIAGAQVFAGFTPSYAGTFNRTVMALYADLEQYFTKDLLVAGALRFERYSDFGSTLNYKLAARYLVCQLFSIRASASTGFRAPGMQQKYYAKTNTLFISTPGGLQPAESGTFPNGSKPAEILGIPELKNETSLNFSSGITARPLPGLEITLDGYLIDIRDRIILTNNFTGGNNAELDSLLRASGASQANFFTNAIGTKSRGLELVINYGFTLGAGHKFRIMSAASLVKNEVKKGDDGKPVVRASPELLSSGQLKNYFNREDQSRIEVASPSWKTSLMVNYSLKKLSANIRVTGFGKVSYLDPSINVSDPASWPVNAFTGERETLDQVFSPKATTDISLGYRVIKPVTITVGSNNVFDVYQDLHSHSGNVSLGRFIYSRRVQQMGTNGRFLFVKISFEPGQSRKSTRPVQAK